MGGIGVPEILALLLVVAVIGVVILFVLRGARAVLRAGAPDGPNTAPCPDCKKTVSRRASTCPHCGAPLSPKS